MTRPPGENLLRKSRILVAPLDWGLGHTTRCIPIIKELLAQNFQVFAAGDRHQERLLREEFPDMPFLTLRGYGIQYSKKNLFLKLISQVPKIILRISDEHRWLQQAVAAHRIDAVISDNRFGLYHQKIPTVFITHQLQVKTNFGRWSEKLLRSWNYHFINRFTECWVPDSNGPTNLAGALSHPVVLPKIPVTYIGLLSRFQTREPLPEFRRPESGHILFILSGPEPQRSLLEDKVINDVSHYPGTATIVRGLPLSLSTIPSTRMIKVFNHLPTNELSREIERAEIVIGRSGYSTVMDLISLGKKAILIPTPGQTEQEYLAAHLHRQGIAFTVPQMEFSLSAALEAAKQFHYQVPPFPAVGLNEVIQTVLMNTER